MDSDSQRELQMIRRQRDDNGSVFVLKTDPKKIDFTRNLHSARLRHCAMEMTRHPAREQAALNSDPYDRWVAPNGTCMAEFHRADGGYLIRFPGQTDFLIHKSGMAETSLIEAWPVIDLEEQSLTNLFHNAILPILGNHEGGLYLHGSSVRVDDPEKGPGAIAFLGLSRGGKTTLAGSFAKAGYPFLTEDVIDLEREGDSYLLQPKRSKLRLFADSARHLLGANTVITDEDRKQDVEAGEALPFGQSAVPLRQIYVLGTDHQADLSVRRFTLQEALSALMPHAFILDVEDKERLRGHFTRMADLVQDIGCYALDYRRDFGELPRVHRAILDNLD